MFIDVVPNKFFLFAGKLQSPLKLGWMWVSFPVLPVL